MKTVSLVALLAACATFTACGGVAPDEPGTASDELLGVEPDEIDCKSRQRAPGVEPDEIDYEGREQTPGVEPDEIDCDGEPQAGASGGVWKTTNSGGHWPSAVGGAAGRTVNPPGTGGAPARGITYGPVITIKPKG